MISTTDLRCPVCGENRLEDAVARNPHHPLLHCTGCGHIFVSPSDLSEAENAEVQLEYFSDSFAARGGFFVNLYERLNARRTARALKLAQQSRILEIGPGSGAVMARLAKLGHDVRGLDLSSAVARQIGQHWHLPVAVEPLDAHVRSVGEGAYDVIVMRHVLEHFTHPLEALRNVRALLKAGGVVYIAVPNMDSWHRVFPGWSGYEPYHVHYFGAQSLSFLLGRAGLQVRELASFESLTGWTNSVLRSLVGRSAAQGGDSPSRGGWKRWILESMRLAAGLTLFPLRWLQAHLGRGEELIILGEKPHS